MHPRKIPAFFGFVFFCVLVSGSIISRKPLQAQNQQAQNAAPSGISVPVKMIDPVDSQTDPAGKQYRASTARAVNAGSGIEIPQGTPATVVLARGPNGWSTQLTALTVEGQAIAVTSSSASVTGAAQNAAATAANAVGSVFGGFGRRAPPAAVTAVATGQRVVLPPGVTLTFVVATPGSSGGAAPVADAAPAASSPPASAPAVSSAPAAASAAPAPTLASSATAAPGQHWFLCTYPQPKDPAKPVLGSWMYYSEFPAIPDLGKGMVDGFDAYVQQKYKIDTFASGHTSGFSNCRRISDDSATRANSMDMFLKQWASSNIEAVRTDWTYTPGAAPAASTAPTTPATPSSQTHCVSPVDHKVIPCPKPPGT